MGYLTQSLPTTTPVSSNSSYIASSLPKNTSLTTPAPAPTSYSTLAAAQAAADADNAATAAKTQTPLSAADQAQLAADLQSSDYSDAWKLAAGLGDPYTADSVVAGTELGGLGAQAGGNEVNTSLGRQQANQGIQDLITQSGLESLDPNATWNATNDAAFYAAAQPYYNAGTTLGSNPFGQWGDPSKLASDAATDAAQNGSAAPNFEQYAGMAPTSNLEDKVVQTAGKYAPGIVAGVITGGALGPATSALGAIASGAASGAVGTVAGDVANQQAVTGKGVLTGATVGGVTGGLNYGAQPAVGALSNATGLGNTASSALVKGGIGAAVGAGAGAVTGTGAARGAEIGGAVQAATGNAGAGSLAGTAAGILASRYLTPSASSSASSSSSGSSSVPGQATTPLVMPSANNGTSTNIGQYSGYGYAPRSQLNPNVTSTYGQGPEAQFFSTEQSAPGSSLNTTVTPFTPTTTTQPVKQSILST